MPYDVHIPYTLDELDETTPAASEDLSLYDDALRQAKAILKNVFLVEHNGDGTHKLSAASLGDKSITSDKIANDTTDDTKRAIATDHVKDQAITAAKLAPNAVASASVADLSITAAKYADLSIAAAKLQADAVTTVKVLDKAITSSKLSFDTSLDTNRAVGTDHLKNACLVARHFQDKQTPASAMALATALVVAGSSAGQGVACQIGGNLSLEVDETTHPPTAKFTVNLGDENALIPFALLTEVSPTGTTSGGGAAVADKWHDRPLAVGAARTFNVVDKSDILDVVGQIITIKKKGSYLVLGYAVALKVNLHQIRLRDVTNGKTLLLGSLEEADAGTNSQSSSVIMGFITVPDDDINVLLQHWTQSAYATNSQAFGRGPQNLTSVNNTEQQTLATLVFIKVA